MQRLTLKGTGKGLCNLPPGPFQICSILYTLLREDMERILKRYQGYEMNGREIKLIKDCDTSRSRSRSLSRRARSLRSRSGKKSRSRSGSRSRRRSRSRRKSKSRSRSSRRSRSKNRSRARSRENSEKAASPRSRSQSTKEDGGGLRKLDASSLGEHIGDYQERGQRKSEGYED